MGFGSPWLPRERLATSAVQGSQARTGMPRGLRHKLVRVARRLAGDCPEGWTLPTPSYMRWMRRPVNRSIRAKNSSIAGTTMVAWPFPVVASTSVLTTGGFTRSDWGRNNSHALSHEPCRNGKRLFAGSDGRKSVVGQFEIRGLPQWPGQFSV